LCRHGINGFAVVRERSAGPDTDAGVDAGSSVPEREHNLSMVVRRMNSRPWRRGSPGGLEGNTLPLNPADPHRQLSA
jgi:hypothetical protein